MVHSHSAPPEVVDALYAAIWSNPPRDCKRVRSPVLAIYTDHLAESPEHQGRRRGANSFCVMRRTIGCHSGEVEGTAAT